MKDNIFQMVANVLCTIYYTTDNNSISECLSFLKTRIELDLAEFKDDIWSH